MKYMPSHIAILINSYNDLSLVLEELNIINNIQVLVNDAERDSWV